MTSSCPSLAPCFLVAGCCVFCSLLALLMLWVPLYPSAYLVFSLSTDYPSKTLNFRDNEVKVVKGKVFDRFVTIWLENIDFESAVADREFEPTAFMPFNRAQQLLFFFSLPNFKALAAQGISLDNYFSVTHPSEGNISGCKTTTWTISQPTSPALLICSNRGASLGPSIKKTCLQPVSRVSNSSTPRLERMIMFGNTSEFSSSCCCCC